MRKALRTTRCGSSSRAAIQRSLGDAQVALTLAGSLRPDDRADRAGVSSRPAPTLAQRSYARKPRSATHDSVSGADSCRTAEPIGRVLRVIYLVFNEGYASVDRSC
jgi:predicted RNA polymerase sigma factor